MFDSRPLQFVIVINLIAAVAYGLAALIGGELTVAPMMLSLIWPPAGIALGVVYLYGLRVLPGLVVGMFLVSLYLSPPDELLAESIVISVALTVLGSLQAIIGAALVRNAIGERSGLTSTDEILRFLLFGALLASLFAPTLGMLFQWLTDDLPQVNPVVMWITWWLGDAVGVAIMAPVTVALLSPDSATWTRKRRTAVVLPSLVLLSLMTAFHWYANQQEMRRLQLVFERMSGGVQARLNRELTTAEDIVLTLQSYIETGASATPEEFSQFASQLVTRHGSVQALEWIPRVTDEQRQEGKLGDISLPEIRETDANRAMVRAAQRSEYYPIVYVVPETGNERAVGYDITTNPKAGQALVLAAQTGAVTTSGPIQLVQDEGRQYGFVLYAPVIDELPLGETAIQGFSAAVFRVADIMNAVIADGLGDELDLNVQDAGDQIFDSRVKGNRESGFGSLTRTATFPVANSTWTITMTTGPEFFPRHFRWDSWWMHAIGFSLTGLLTALLTALTGRSLVIERVVRERTGELNSAIRQLDAHNEILRNVAAADLPVDTMTLFILKRLEWAYPQTRFTVSLLAEDQRTLDQTISPSMPRPFVRSLTGNRVPLIDARGIPQDRHTFSAADLADWSSWSESRELLQEIPVEDALWQVLVSGNSEVLGVLGIYLLESDTTFTVTHLLDDSAKLLTLALERHKTMANIRRLAFFDSLTGIPNREQVIGRLQEEMAYCEHHDCFSAVLFIDIDDLKDVNDSLGHREGDRLLCEVAMRVSSICREHDLAGRLGGDEFVVVVASRSQEPEDMERAIHGVFADLRARLSTPLQLHSYDHHVSISVGASLIPQPGCDASTIIQQADTAMYQAKSHGKNNLCLYQAEMKALAHEQFDIAKGLEEALNGGSLELYYQYQFNSDAQATAAEALLRWHHPERGLLAASQFIDVAERTSLIIRIGEWAIDQACAFLKAHEWLEYLAINISPRHLARDNFVDQVLERVAHYGIASNRLALEITEHSLIENLTDNLGKLQALRDAGVQIAMDDFGTGYSSLFYIRQLPLSQIKIDKVFVADVLNNPHDAFIVGSIITLAEQMGIDFVAEGVETQEQFEFLKSQGCRRFQGFLFSRPEPASALMRERVSTETGEE